MATLKQLTLDGAVSLLTYLQFDCMTDEKLGAMALTATLCEMLNQLNENYPGIVDIYGWRKMAHPQTTVSCDTSSPVAVNGDRYSVFGETRLS